MLIAELKHHTGAVVGLALTAGGDLIISFINVPEWSASPTVSVDMKFASNGDVIIDNHSAGAGWGTSTIVGFSPGGGASGNSVTWSSLLGSTTAIPAGEAVYEFVNGGSPSGFTSLLLDSSNNVTVN